MSEAVALRTVEILRIGHKGDGETADGLYVPYTVPGDVVRVEAAGDGRAKLVEIVKPGPTRGPAPCKHYTFCGGCILQHVEPTAYRDWKRDQIVQALSQRGIANIDIAPLVAVDPRTRRRAVLTGRMVRETAMIGFQERGTNFIVDMEECHVLHPELTALIAPMRKLLVGILPDSGRAEIDITRSDSGIDMTLGLPRVEIDGPLRTKLAAVAAALNLARLTVNGELVAQTHPPVIRWAGAEVTPPPGSFLQAVPEAERALQNLVVAGVGPAKRIADLFSGCGTFTFALARHGAVQAFDSETDAIAALTAAARNAQGLKPITAERRDLFRRPLQPRELDAFDAVVLDPPRAGAKVQSEQLALSKVRRIVAVSCAPATFARDARILIDGGYALTSVTPIDQFLWTPHIELVAIFERS
jgi:23S rRNA (uracil1939-C5)-methyltransferase